MPSPNLIGGTAYLKIDGVQHMSRGDWSYNPGRPKRNTVYDGDLPAGYSEEPQEPVIEGEMTVPATLDVIALVETDDATITLELKNGVVAALRNAWWAAEGTVEVREGKIDAKFVGKSMEITR